MQKDKQVGISRPGARLLLEEARLRPFHGRILQIGRQQLFFNQAELDRLAALHSVVLNKTVPQANATVPLGGDVRCIDDGSFFSEIGFSSVESLDFSGDDAPTHIHNMNVDVPVSLENRFDCIYDGGTIEHIFDVRNVLRNIFCMLKVGGRAIHFAASSNYVDHGFYMFSPTLFYDFYATNNFKIYEIQLCVHSASPNDEPWSIYDYEPGCLDALSFGGFDLGRGKMLGIFVSAEKTPESTWHRIPQQAVYARTWSNKDSYVAPQPRARKAILPAPGDPIPNKVAEY